MKRNWLLALTVLALISVVAAGCRDFSNDPVKWSFVGGDGSWNSDSRQWTVSLSPGQTRQVEIQLYNSGSQTIKVFTLAHCRSDLIGLSPQQRISLRAGSSVIITFSADAAPGAASGRYTVDYGDSFYEEQ